jgi:hypothetical protein
VRHFKISCVVFGLILATSWLVGCSLDRSINVEPGGYIVGAGRGAYHQLASEVIRHLEIDRDRNLVVLSLADGSEISTAFSPRQPADWPEGCPTNIYTYQMEVLEIEQSRLMIGEVAMDNPVLVRDCPPEPEQVVLREDGDIGNARGASGTACSWTDTCISFKPQQELHWRAEDQSISTSLGSPVAIDILVSADQEFDELDASTFAIIEDPEFGSVVDNLEQKGTIREEVEALDDGTFMIRIIELLTYNPHIGFRGRDSFTYRICDMDGYCDAARISVAVE